MNDLLFVIKKMTEHTAVKVGEEKKKTKKRKQKTKKNKKKKIKTKQNCQRNATR